MYPFWKSPYRMRQRHALYTFPVLPQYASMVRTQNQVDSNPLDLLAGCTRVVAVCPQKRHYNAQFLQQRITSEAYEGVGKGGACGSVCCRPFQPLLAACRWDFSAPRDWQALPGSQTRCTPRKSSLNYRKCQPQLSHRGLECHVGMQAAFGRATVRILGIGKRSRS
jgi:hypothetical protein